MPGGHVHKHHNPSVPNVPGVPNPFSVGTILDHFTTFKTRLPNLDWIRYYIAGEPTWSSIRSDLTTNDAAGVKHAISFKTNGTFAQVASGSKDAYITSLANGIAADLVTPGLIIYYHEPEDNVDATDNTPAQFRSAFSRIISIMDPILPPNWEFWNCLMLYTFSTDSTYPTGAARNPDDFYVAGLNGIGIDFYNKRSPTGGYGDPATPDLTPEAMFHYTDTLSKRRIDLRDYLASKGNLPFGYFEFGSIAMSGDPTGVARTAYLNNLAEYLLANPPQGLKFFDYYERNAGEGGSADNWRIAYVGGSPGDETTSTDAFARFRGIGGTQPTHPTNYVLSIADKVDRNQYVTPAVGCQTDDLLLVGVVATRSGTTPVVPTVSGAGLGAFTQLGGIAQSFDSTGTGTKRTMTVWGARASSGHTPQAITVDFAGVTHTSCDIHVIRIAGTKSTSLTTADSKAVGNSTTSGSTISATLAAPGAGSHRTIFFASQNLTSTATPKSGFRQVNPVGNGTDNSVDKHGSPSLVCAVIVNDSSFDTTPSVTFSGAGIEGGIGTELALP